nr:reverse transcriptase domain-containing protein [Tanacetum cinerariifolium]
MSITGVLGRSWRSSTDWPETNSRDNGKDRIDQAENPSCPGSTKELSEFETEVDGVRSWREGYAQGLALKRGCTIRLELPQELSRVHHTFHVSNLKKCYADEPLVIPLEGIHVDDRLQFVEEPVEIIEREIKRLKRIRIPLVKVRWNSRRVGNAEKRGNASRDPDSYVVTGTFLLTNRHASILFDTGADRSFISTTFSYLIDIVPTPLENSYDVELADGKIVREDPPEVPMADNRTMAKLLQAPTEGYEDTIVIPEIAANNFELKHGLIHLVQNKQFFEHDKEDPHAHIRYFNKITSTMRVPNVPSSSIKLMLFPFSLEGQPGFGSAQKRTPRSILNWDDLVSKFINQFFPPSKTTNLRNEITRFQQRFDESFYEAWDRFNDLLRDSLNSAAGGNFLDKMPRECLKIIKSKSKDMVSALLLDKKNQSLVPSHSSPTPAPVKAVEPNCVTCGGAHSYQNCPATNRNVYRDNIQEYVSQAAAANYNQGNTSFRPQMVANQIRPPVFPLVQTHQTNQNNLNRGNNFNQNRGGSGTLPSNTITNPKEELKGITTRSDISYQGPTIPTPSKVVKQGTEVTKDQVQTPSSQSTAPVQPSVFQSETQTPISEPIVAPVSALMPNLKSFIPYPYRRDNERHPLIGNKEKLSEMARTPMNEHCSAVILNKLPRKLGDPDKFLIPCEFPGMDECLELADLGASINLMPLFVWEALLLPKLTPTCMTLEIADRLVSKPIGIAKDIPVKVGVFHFPADFVVVDFEPNPRVPLILGSDFLLFEEADAFLGLEDDPNSLKIKPFYYDLEGDILLLEAILNSEPFPPLPNHEQYMPSFKKELQVCEAKTVKSSVDEPPEILIEEDYKPAVQNQRRVNPKIYDVIKKEVEKLLDAGLIYQISDSPWVSPVHCIPKKGGFTVVTNEENELILTRLVIEWRVCIDYRKLNEATRKDHFPLPFMDQMLERLAWNEYYCFLDGFFGNFQIPIDPRDQEKTTFTCPYGTFAYRRMPFSLCNAPGTFQRCILAIFHDMVEKTMEVFMDDFLVFGNSFEIASLV